MIPSKKQQMPWIAVSCLAVLLLVPTGCKSEETTVESRKVIGTTVHPVLELLVVNISGDAKVISLSGEAYILKKGEKQYQKIVPTGTVSVGDIVQMVLGSALELADDGTTLTIKAVSKDMWYTFEKKTE